VYLLAACPSCTKGADQAKQQQQQDGEALVQLQVFLQCFEVTFFYEQYLVALRAQAFNREKKCERGHQAMAAAAQHSSLCGVVH
jgi:hypothetical protein